MIVTDSVTGEKRAEFTLPSPPVFNGLALASGRILVASEDGSVTCFAGR